MRVVFTISLLCSALFVAGALVGCQQSALTDTAAEQSATDETSPDTFNDVCPIMGGKVTDEGRVVEWNGKRIGFCCPGCDEKWEQLSEEEKAEKLGV